MADDLDSNLLQWQAFLYISGELDAEATTAFEQILLEDQTAREAVASAVELVQAVGAVGLEASLILTLPDRSRRRRLTVVTVAAAVLVTSALIPWGRPTSNLKSDDSSVARAWSGLRQGIDADWKAVVAGSASTDPVDSGLPTDSDSAVEPSGERPLPSWLLSAASVPRGDSPQEEN